MPKAPLKKRLKYLFHLLVPAIEFALVIICVFTFSRCTPLAPSLDHQEKTITKEEKTETKRVIENTKKEIIKPEFKSLEINEVILTNEKNVVDLIKQPNVKKLKSLDTNKTLIENIKVATKQAIIELTDEEINLLLSTESELIVNVKNSWLRSNSDLKDIELKVFHEYLNEDNLFATLALISDANDKDTLIAIENEALTIKYTVIDEDKILLEIKINSDTENNAIELKKAIKEAQSVRLITFNEAA